MWKWVIIIATICIACVVAEETFEAFRPRRPDEELILEAILSPQPSSIIDRIHPHEKFNPFDREVGVFDEWSKSKGTFRQNLEKAVSDLEHSLPSFRALVSDPRLSAEDRVMLHRDLDYDERNLDELKRVQRQLPRNTMDSHTPVRPIKTLKLPPSFVFGKNRNTIGPTSWIIPADLYTFESPIFTADHDYAFVKYSFVGVASLQEWAVLARNRHGWRVVAEGSAFSWSEEPQ
ncbi:MAG: hypothetical protein GC165_03490 [Armatimonadetes bacterium]|nr:hypothetical protein [Armatimonadota bacterium]